MEVSKVKSLFSPKISRCYKDEFSNEPMSREQFPKIWKLMDDKLDYRVVATNNSKGYDVSVPKDMIDFQWHRSSIEEHTDDIAPKTYFQVALIDVVRKVKSGYDTRPLFTFYDIDGKKQSSRLVPEDCVIFNPRRPHSMIYYGSEYVVALRTVVRK